MRRFKAVTSVLLTLLLPLAAPAQESRPESKAETPERKASDERLASVLMDAFEMVKAVGKREQSPEQFLRESFRDRVDPEVQAETLLSIGTALARVGKREAAQSAWIAAADAAEGINESETKVDLLTQLALTQAEHGDQEAVTVALQQAARAIRQFNPGFRIGMFGGDPTRVKAGALCMLADAQAKTGQQSTARKTFAQAVEVASSIKGERERIAGLMEIAEAEAPADALRTRKQAWQYALESAPDASKMMAVETVIRGSANAGALEEAIQVVERELKGDVKAYALWALADAAGDREGEVPRELIARMLEMATKMEFERSSRKAVVFIRIAQLQAIAGDEDGAYRTLGTIAPDNAVVRSKFYWAKLNLMLLVARAQLKAKDRNGATNTVQVALEMLDPLLREQEAWTGPVVQIAELLARAGDSQGALETAGRINSSKFRIDALVRISKVQTEAKDYELARKTLAKALTDVEHINAEDLWDHTALERSEREVWGAVPRTRSRRKGRRSDPSTYGGLFEGRSAYDALSKIASAQAEARDVPGALKTASSIPTGAAGASTERAEALQAIARSQAKTGDFKAALATVANLPDDEHLPSYFTRGPFLEDLALEQAKAGDAAGVLEWARAQKPTASRLSALRGMAEGIVENLGAADKTSSREGEREP